MYTVSKVVNIKNITIPKNEVLRYLGYKKQSISVDLEETINSAIKEAESLIDIKYVYSKHNTIISNEGVLMEGTNLILRGNDIKKHLRYAKETIIMAATLGVRIETKIRFYEKIDLTRALILDSCATAAIEEVCDKIEEHIKKEAEENDLGITFRYSPGYGDLPLDTQGRFISALRADKAIGLTASEHHLLMPRKSVTAIIGLIPIGKYEDKKGCVVCANYKNCTFRKEGVTCGH